MYMQVKKQQLEVDMEQQTGSKIGKYVKAVCCHPTYLTYMENTPCMMLGWMMQKLESRLLEEISITSDNTDDTTFMAESKEEIKSFLMKVKKKS